MKSWQSALNMPQGNVMSSELKNAKGSWEEHKKDKWFLISKRKIQGRSILLSIAHRSSRPKQTQARNQSGKALINQARPAITGLGVK